MKLFFLPLAFGVVAWAGPVTYTLNFGTNAPLSGSFTYDSSLAIGSQFTAFSVQWSDLYFTNGMENITFDLVSEANAPSVKGTACPASPTSASFFAFLLGTPQCGATDPGIIQFDVHNTPAGSLVGLAILTICDVAGSGVACSADADMEAQRYTYYSLPVPEPDVFQYSFDFGDVTVTPATTTPEPTALFLVFAGAAGLAVRKFALRPGLRLSGRRARTLF